jgi:hypothetical protein
VPINPLPTGRAIEGILEINEYRGKKKETYHYEPTNIKYCYTDIIDGMNPREFLISSNSQKL